MMIAGAALWCSSSAMSDVVIADWDDDENFSYQIQYMPDLDQRRFGLPGDGSMFCVPTATMNLFAYVAEWGLDQFPPGPGVYQHQVTHSVMTNHLDDLGDMMDTGTDGTGVNAWLTGSLEWIDDFNLVRTADYRMGDYCPTLSTAAHAAACGSLVAVCYGRFEFNPSTMPVVADNPSGGHCVTMIRAVSNGPDSLELWVRDPGDSGDSIFSQSPWSYRIYNPIENMFIQHDWDGNGLYTPHEVTVLEYDERSDLIRILYKVYQITPGFGFSFDGVELNFHGIAGFDFTVGPQPTHFEPTPGFSIVDAALHPNLHSSIALLQQGSPTAPARLVTFDRANGEMHSWHEAVLMGQMCVGRNRDVYTAGIGMIRRFDIDNPEVPAGGSDPQWVEVNSLAWPNAAQAIEFNDRTDQVFVLSTSSRKLLVTPPSLGSEVEPVFEYAVPTLVPAAADASMAFDNDYSNIFVCIPSTHQLFRLTLVNPGPSGSINAVPVVLPGNPQIEHVSFDDRGHMLVTEMLDATVARVLEYAPSTTGGGWTLQRNSQYEELRVGPKFHVARSRSNFDPDVNALDEVAIPVETLPEIGSAQFDCAGDIVTSATVLPPPDGVVDGADLAYLIGEWGVNPGSPANIVNNAFLQPPPDGVVDGADLAVLIGGWGPCD